MQLFLRWGRPWCWAGINFCSPSHYFSPDSWWFSLGYFILLSLIHGRPYFSYIHIRGHNRIFYRSKNWDRTKATLIFGSLVTLVGVFCSMSFGGFDDFSKILNISFFDFLDYLSSKYMLPIGGFFTALFILSKWGVKNFYFTTKCWYGKRKYKSNTRKNTLCHFSSSCWFYHFQ